MSLCIITLTRNQIKRMTRLDKLIDEVAEAREDYITHVGELTSLQSKFKPSVEIWSITENTEHLVWGEQIGIMGVWTALEGMKNNKPIWRGDPVHAGLTIEEIVAKTWKEKEVSQEMARPKWGGALEYWISALRNNQSLLISLAHALNGFNLEEIIYPHPISGPLDVFQRIEFFRFHLNRHQAQVERAKSHRDFPNESWK